MSGSLRKVAAVLTAICTLYFVYWTGGAILYGLGAPSRVDLFIAAAAAIYAGRLVWNSGRSGSPGFFRSVVLGGLLTGAAGFAVGFFGPIVLTPGANQGPLLGLLITGPLGLVFGAMGGAIRWMIVRRRHVPGESA
jgi:hypothetical protein